MKGQRGAEMEVFEGSIIDRAKGGVSDGGKEVSPEGQGEGNGSMRY